MNNFTTDIGGAASWFSCWKVPNSKAKLGIFSVMGSHPGPSNLGWRFPCGRNPTSCPSFATIPPRESNPSVLFLRSSYPSAGSSSLSWIGPIVWPDLQIQALRACDGHASRDPTQFITEQRPRSSWLLFLLSKQRLFRLQLGVSVNRACCCWIPAWLQIEFVVSVLSSCGVEWLVEISSLEVWIFVSCCVVFSILTAWTSQSRTLYSCSRWKQICLIL